MNAITRLPAFDLPTVFPQLGRLTVGFDKIFDELHRRTSMDSVNQGNYPPFNIIKVDDNNYRIEVAVAGFKKDEITVSLENNVLTVSGSQVLRQDPESSEQYLHQGISARHFQRTFTLADHMEVTSAEVVDGILTISVNYVVPEALKPRLIEIK